MKTFIILGAGSDSVSIIRRLKKMGLHVTALDANNRSIGFDEANDYRVVSCYDHKACLEATEDMEVVGVLCGGVDSPLAQSVIASKHEVVGPSYGTARLSRDKLLQFAKLVSSGVMVPQWHGEKRNGPGGHIVLKPVDSRGARGVFRIPDSSSQEEINRWMTESRKHSASGGVLIQRWVPGIQLSTESIVVNGQVVFTAIAERNYSRLEEFAPHVIEDGSDTPWIPHWDGTGPDPETRVKTAIQQCVTALGLKHGTIKGDLVYHGLVTVIEVAVRLSGGGFCSEIIPTAYGYDFVGVAAEIAMGNLLAWKDQPFIPSQCVCQRFEFPTRPEKHPDRGPYRLGVGRTREEARADLR